MPLLNFSMLDQSSIVMHIVQRNRVMMLTIFKIWEEKDWRVELYISSSKVYLSTVLVRIIKMPYKHPQVSRKDEKDDNSALCVSMFTFNGKETLVGFLFITWHMIVLFLWSGLLSHMWLIFYIVVVLFLFFCAIRSPLSFHSSVDLHRGKRRLQ